MRLKKSLLRKKRKNESIFKYIMSVSHLWLGLLSSVVVFVVCMSGATYSFKTQIQELLNYDVVFSRDSKGDDFVSINVLQNQFESEGLLITSITIPETTSRNILVTYKDQTDEEGHFYVHPENGKIIGTSSSSAGDFFNLMKQIHKELLLGKVGKQIVGASILIFVVLLLSGLVVWFPKKTTQLKKGLTIKWSAKLPRVIYDLHNTLGFYTFILLLFISVTGLYVSYSWVKSGIIVSLGGVAVLSENSSEAAKAEMSNVFASFLDDVIDSQSDKQKELKEISLDSLLSDVNLKLPYKAITILDFPTEEEAYYHITKINQENLLKAILPDEIEYTKEGEFKSLQKFTDQPLHKQFTAISLPLHTGEIMGLPGIILYFIATLIAASMPVTGILIWVRKL
ncbi:PepSY-associated TM helix domain-containing protein [Flammeovirga kamogawensis]|uniref:PepSY domain-containing protein n=1 Tax=Flammeovirga kamogawensis TaxID=373891 RepID=A0ABX8H1Y7_9BACT|nr:PepSY-associated TM helix domain-containing protein [Flammeovirga kamogawensis]MBB6463263.1 putative iron-regulated membrane protein [Flammeovirga kamogawensis]QWG09587.1 PepSY domain-containing protein [Flammeovirga kamogawensis]TRX65102.1 PepSY domain-containing protein [Flammeovirga kamogawensis]